MRNVSEYLYSLYAWLYIAFIAQYLILLTRIMVSGFNRTELLI